MFKIAKNPLVASALAAAALTVAASLTTPTQAQEPNCTAELQAIDSVFKIQN